MLHLLPPRQQNYHPSDKSAVIQVQFAKAMTEMSPQDGIGLALGYLLLAMNGNPKERNLLRVALNEQVIREGFSGTSFIAELTRAAR